MICDPNFFKGIGEIINVDGHGIGISAKCADSTTRYFSSVEELLAFPNATDRRILGLGFVSLSREDKIVFTLKDASTGSVAIEISGEDAFVTKKSEILMTEIAEARAWFSKIYHARILMLMFTIGWQTLALCLIFALLLKHMAEIGKLTYTYPVAMFAATLAIWGFIIAVAVFLLPYIKRSVFPLLTFNFGHQVKNYTNLEWLRKALASSFLLSPLAALLYALWKF